jgi:NAD(P)-dependent dehydrogenase (short-subunit alcohol dehydrogenase family)
MPRLSGKIALVTGGARGIGAAVARAFADAGAARIVVTDIRDQEGAALAADLAHARYTRLDVRAEADWIRVIEEILTEDGRLDVLVNNAGVTGLEEPGVALDPEAATLESWRAIHASCLDGTFLGCKHAIRAMRATGTGSIVNMASRSGLVGIPGAAAYASAKAAMINHTRTVALYCAEQGLQVRCNAISPAAIDTPMWEPMVGQGPDREAKRRAIYAETPLQRFGTAEEVAQVAVMLASDEATYMTGSNLVLDGGILAGSANPPGGET